MGSSGSKKSKMPKIAATQFDTNPESYQNIGYTQTMNPFTAQGKPSWMQGHFAMDSWGKSAADPRISLTQDMLSPYGMPIHDQAVRDMGQYDQQMAQFNRNPQAMAQPQMPEWMQQGGQPMGLDQARAMYQYQQPQAQVQPPAPTGKSQQLAQGMGGLVGQMSPEQAQMMQGQQMLAQDPRFQQFQGS
jgi:hypothetical protein